MSLKVLIVDDDPVIVLMHKRLIAKTNISLDPLTFQNGKAAFDFIEKDKNNDEDNETDEQNHDEENTNIAHQQLFLLRKNNFHAVK